MTFDMEEHDLVIKDYYFYTHPTGTTMGPLWMIESLHDRFIVWALETQKARYLHIIQSKPSKVWVDNSP